MSGSPRLGFLLGHVFLGPVAPRVVDLILVLEVIMGAALLIGGFLARLGRFRQHAWCQSIVVLVNAMVIAVLMIPSFSLHVYPRIPAKLGRAYYGLATMHAALGTLAEIVGLYILLAVGTKLLPSKLRIANYKVWMRSVLVLWWVALALGIATYIRWYVPH
jgi:hypothetical protein